MTRLLLGVNLGFAVKRWPEPEEWSRILSEMGIEYAQYSFDLHDPLIEPDPAVFERIQTVARSNGITITSAITGNIAFSQNFLTDPRDSVRNNAVRWYEHAIEAAGRMGVSAVGSHYGSMTVRQFNDKAETDKAVTELHESILALTKVAERSRVECLVWEIQPVARDYPAYMDDVEEMLTWNDESAVPIKLCLDLGHACVPGAPEGEHDPYAWLERFGSHTRIVHLQQTDGLVDRHWPFTSEHNSNGIIQADKVLEKVRKWDHDEVELILEPAFRHDTPLEQILSDLQTSVTYWQSALADA